MSSETKTLSLYDREKEWLQLEEMLAEPFENSDESLVALVEKTFLALQEKRDSFCAFLAFLETQQDFAAGEIERLDVRKKRIAAAQKRLERLAVDTIRSLGKDEKDRWKRLEGQTSSLSLAKNPASAEINDDRAVPDVYKSIEVSLKMPISRWASLVKVLAALEYPLSKDPVVSIDLKAVGEDLKRMVPCEDCGELGVVQDGLDKEKIPVKICPVCNGDKQIHASVPGARLVTDRVRLVRK